MKQNRFSQEPWFIIQMKKQIQLTNSHWSACTGKVSLTKSLGRRRCSLLAILPVLQNSAFNIPIKRGIYCNELLCTYNALLCHTIYSSMCAGLMHLPQSPTLCNYVLSEQVLNSVMFATSSTNPSTQQQNFQTVITVIVLRHQYPPSHVLLQPEQIAILSVINIIPFCNQMAMIMKYLVMVCVFLFYLLSANITQCNR